MLALASFAPKVMTSTVTLPSPTAEPFWKPEPSEARVPERNPAKTEQPENHEDLQGTVKSVVDDVVKDAVFEASLSAEKADVQRLINNLVTRVRDESMAASAKPRSAALEKAPPKGVPYADHRPRQLTPYSPVSWGQTMDYVTMNLAVPASVRKQHVSISFTPGSVQARVIREDSSTLVEVGGPLVAQIDVDGCIWSLEGSGDARMLTIELEKAREQWWARLFLADDPADYMVVEASDRLDTVVAEGRAMPTAARTVENALVGDGNAQSDENNVVDHGEVSPPVDVEDEAEGSKDELVEDLKDAVTSVVRETIDSVVSNLSKKQVSTPTAESSASSGLDGKQRQQRKVLTRADLPKMVEQYKEAFKKGGPGASEAALQLATFYHHGIGVEQDDAQAARLYRHALENGALDASAAFQLGLIYNQGADGLEPDPPEAVRWWKVSAGLGNAVAMYNLGVMLMNGSGCDMDPTAALRWFRQARMLNPQLRTPEFSESQLEERMAIAAKVKKERMKQALPPEERQRRREEALRTARQIAYGSAAIAGIGVSMLAIRYWWRNRL